MLLVKAFCCFPHFMQWQVLMIQVYKNNSNLLLQILAEIYFVKYSMLLVLHALPKFFMFKNIYPFKPNSVSHQHQL